MNQSTLKYKDFKMASNPRYKTFTQAIYTAGDISQFEEALPRKPVVFRNCNATDNIYKDVTSLLPCDEPESELYTMLESRDVYNTFLYIFYKFKKGIFVSINERKVAAFLPFSNAFFRNEWFNLIQVDPKKYGSLKSLLDKISITSGFKPQQILPLVDWQANNNIFRYDVQSSEGDNNLVIIKDMIDSLVRTRDVPDIEFFINKRDFPILRYDGTEPYTDLYGPDKKLLSYSYEKYAPIFSCSTASDFADLPIPTYEDWARIKYQKSGKTFPNSFTKYPRIVFTPWDQKQNVAVFRGSSTGSGITPLTNQRLKALELSQGPDNKGRLDVGITKWNLRPRKCGKY